MQEVNKADQPLKSQVLADFINSTVIDDIPESIQQKAVGHIMDSVAAGVAGAVSLETKLVLDTLHDQGETQGISSAWGTGQTLTPLSAALLNGVSSHSFEVDDTGGCDHSGAVVLPATIAAVEYANSKGTKVTGKQFVAAVVLGYDLARRALESCGAYAPHNKAGFHSTGTCGTFGSAAASAKILDLSSKEIQMALGLAGSFSAGLWACVHDGAQSKRIHAGHAAMGGLMSTLLAKHRFTGPTQIYETVWGGFDNTFAPNSRVPEAWEAELGENWKIGRVSIKPHAACRSAHSSIDAVNILRDKGKFKASDIESIDIEINPFVYGMCGAFACHPMPSAQLSIPYSVSADLIFGSASLPSYEREKRDDPRIQELMQRIHFKVNKALPDLDEPTVSITLKDGRKFTEKVEVALGAPANPLTKEKIKEKAASLIGMVYSNEMTEKLLDSLMSIENSKDVYEDLVTLLRQKPSKTELFHV